MLNGLRGCHKRRRKAVIRKVKREHGYLRCFVCGKGVLEREATVEHIVPIAKGGADELENLAISHALCNVTKADKLPGSPTHD